MGTKRACRLLLAVCLLGCGDDETVAEDTQAADTGTAETDGGDTGTGGEPDPDPDPVCVELAMTPVDHAAFDEGGCSDAADESTVLSTQAEIDAHVAAYCELCCSSCKPNDCKAPKLEAGSTIVYAHVTTPHGPAVLDILSVEDCGERLVVTAVETVGCQTALDVAWDSVVVEAEAKPVELVTEPGPDLCAEPP